jgi:cyanophycin synthetase
MEHKRSVEDLDSSTRFIKEAAERKGIKFTEIVYYKDEVEHEIYELSYQGQSHLMDITSPDTTSSIGNTIADNKYLTHKMLDKLKAPCAPYAMFNQLNKALHYFKSLDYPCVVKPIHGGGGDGVSVNISTKEEFESAFNHAQTYCSSILIEQYHEGADTRFLVINGKVEAIAKREPGFVIGNGILSIDALVTQTNTTRAEGRKGHLSKLKIDKIATDYLFKQGLSLDDIPNKGKRIYVRPNANLNTGGVSSCVDFDKVNKENIKLIESVSKAFRLSVAGIDVISPDISVPFSKNKGIILEINDRPRIRMHEMPHEGSKMAVSEKIVAMLFKL